MLLPTSKARHDGVGSDGAATSLLGQGEIPMPNEQTTGSSTGLKLGAAKLRTLAEVLHISELAVCVTSAFPPYEIMHTNRAWSDLTGWSFVEVAGETCRILQGEATSPEAIASLRVASESKLFCRAELINYTRLGEPFRCVMEQIGPVIGGTHLYAVIRGEPIPAGEIPRRGAESTRWATGCLLNPCHSCSRCLAAARKWIAEAQVGAYQQAIAYQQAVLAGQAHHLASYQGVTSETRRPDCRMDSQPSQPPECQPHCQPWGASMAAYSMEEIDSMVRILLPTRPLSPRALASAPSPLRPLALSAYALCHRHLIYPRHP